MALVAIPTPKRIEPSVIMTETFNERELAKKTLKEAGPAPDFGKGFDVELSVCTQDIEGKTYARAYWKPVVTSIDGILTLAESDPIGLLKDLNYGSGLYYNSLVREAIATENSGPAEAAKSFDKQVKEFIKQRAILGKPVSEDKARAFLKAQMEAEL